MPTKCRVGEGRVLFVDDDPFYRDIASATLTEAGFSVVAVEDGATALTQLANTEFDLLVLDLELPELSGFDVIERIASVLKRPHLPILVITGHDDTASVEQAFNLGVKSFLAKPLNWPLFVHHVNFVLKSARTEASLRDASRTAAFMSDLKSRLVNTLVTEFQSPLRQAYGFATLLKQQADGPIESALYTNWIDDLHQSLDRLNGTHARMLNFGRSLSESIVLNEEVFNFGDIVAAALAASQDLMQRRNLGLKQHAGVAGPILLRGDRVLLDQAIRSLVDNAVRFSRRGSSLQIDTSVRPDGNFCLTILDASPVLSAAQIDEILGTASSLQQSTSQNVEVVTALKMSRVVIEAHQGQLRMSAVGGEGTRTEIELPQARLASGKVSSIAQHPPTPPRLVAASPLRNAAGAR